MHHIDDGEVRGWFTGRIPADWFTGPVTITSDRERSSWSATSRT